MLFRISDVRAISLAIIDKGVESTGDYGSGGQCPFCYKDCAWNASSLNDIEHERDCAFLVAKDVMTGLGQSK